MATFLSFFHLFALFLVFSPWANGQGSPKPDPSRSLRLCKVQKVTSSPGPTMDAIRFGLDRLLDGKLPKDGWRSTWTAWYQKDPAVTFDLGEIKRIGAIRVYFQAWAREDELKSVEIAVGLDGENFFPFNEYGEIVTLQEKGTWVEMDLRAVRARYFKISPKFQGWGHQWGEVEFWEISK
ncbi:discoidin domain-containing protein [Opitutales bacterium]|nr:discoidin domain-containing protein [Opitutales bacterium]MDC3284738.1 discoidin domain-containing protein [Opitutales bacterium]